MPVATSYGTQGTETGVLGMNSRHTGGGKPIVACHGRTSLGTMFFDPLWLQSTCMALCEANYVVLSPDLSGSSPWGNDASQTKVGDAKTRLQASGVNAASGRIGLLGGSAGALTALNWARANPTLVACIALALPVVDLAYEHDNNVQGFATEIETAYGGASGYTSAVATHDPMQNTSSYAGVPMKMWLSPSDTVAITARQQAFATATSCPTSPSGANDHSGAFLPTAEIVQFFQAHL